MGTELSSNLILTQYFERMWHKEMLKRVDLYVNMFKPKKKVTVVIVLNKGE